MSLVYGSVATGAVRPADFVVIQVLTAAALVLWLARFWLNRGHRIQWTPLCWLVIAFLIYALIRYHQADIEYTARQELLRVVVYAALFFLVLNNLHRQKTTQLLVNVMLVVGMLIALYAIYQVITNAKHVLGFEKPAVYRGRGSGTFICPNNLAGYLELLLPLALANLFLGKGSHVGRVFYAYISLVLLAGIGVTISRGGWIATCLGLLVFFSILAAYRAHRLRALAALLAILVGAYFFIQYARRPQERIAKVLAPGQLDDAHVRLDLMRTAYRMWQDNFWFGVGPAHFDYRFRAYRPPAVQSRPYWVHNDYLNALVDWGVVGGGIIGLALLSLGAGALKTWKAVQRMGDDLAARQSDRAAHVLGAGVGLLTLMFHSVVDFNMQVPAIASLAVVLMASLSSHLRFATDKYWVTPHFLGRVLATIVLTLAIAFLTTQALARYRAIGCLRQANLAKTHPERIAALKSAYLAEPADADIAYMVGEAYRLWSWDGPKNWEQLAHQALPWFETAMLLNPYETYNYLRYGMCLDWLKRFGQAERFFREALSMDPNNYYLVAMQGWHCIQKQDYQKAKEWLLKSLELKWYDNSIANVYLEVVNRRLAGQD